jgi:hypothetical protein
MQGAPHHATREATPHAPPHWRPEALPRAGSAQRDRARLPVAANASVRGAQAKPAHAGARRLRA